MTRIYAQLGTAYLYRQVQDVTGSDPYAPDAASARGDTIMKIFRAGALKPDQL